ncbi:MAG: hypothetical protein KTV68_06400 [Acidimicrobiia bacterium]|nr:hypothetical protein [Acidimicrobiia bacterium]MCY4435664.1 hypothetical protein [bacterium]
MTQLVDDRVLSALLQGRAPPQPEQPVYTTGCWYVRLCQAALSSTVSGTLSSSFAELPPKLVPRALHSLLELPEEIGLVSLRTLAPLIGRLRSRHRQLNLLSIEALAAALHLDAQVYLLTPTPPLQDALAAEGRQAVILA